MLPLGHPKLFFQLLFAQTLYYKYYIKQRAPFSADDLVIVAPLHKALQILVNIYYQIGVTLDIKFNATKTICMVIRATEFTNFDILRNLLNENRLNFVNQ